MPSKAGHEREKPTLDKVEDRRPREEPSETHHKLFAAIQQVHGSGGKGEHATGVDASPVAPQSPRSATLSVPQSPFFGMHHSMSEVFVSEAIAATGAESSSPLGDFNYRNSPSREHHVDPAEVLTGNSLSTPCGSAASGDSPCRFPQHPS